MVEVNEYFDGKVKSLGIDSSAGRKTIGVMEPGEYEFKTENKEVMTVIVGEISVYFAEGDEWEDFGVGSCFDAPAQRPGAFLRKGVTPRVFFAFL